MLARYQNGLIVQMESFKQEERQVYKRNIKKKNQKQTKKHVF